MLRQIRERTLAGKRLDRAEGHWLLTEAPLLDLGSVAQEARFQRIPDKRVTFVIDSNPNYTNVCITDCQFCAFYRKPGDKEAWTLTVEEVMAKVDAAARQGATTVLLQGGHNPALPLDYYLSLVRETVRRFPGVTPHYFTASEICTIAEVSGKTMPEILALLREAGQSTLPGGGAEVLSEKVRRRIEPKKGGPAAWLDVHREAHRQGFKSTATMMYGHVETLSERVEHMSRIRELQDETRGFRAFISWTFQDDGNRLGAKVSRDAMPTSFDYLLTQAVSRIYLDNVDHIQSSWVTQGMKIGQVALEFGADDLGSIMIEENVVSAAGTTYRASTDDFVRTIKGLGKIPVQRDTLYRDVRVWN